MTVTIAYNVNIRAIPIPDEDLYPNWSEKYAGAQNR